MPAPPSKGVEQVVPRFWTTFHLNCYLGLCSHVPITGHLGKTACNLLEQEKWREKHSNSTHNLHPKAFLILFSLYLSLYFSVFSSAASVKMCVNNSSLAE